jgi:hypothetical protein
MPNHGDTHKLVALTRNKNIIPLMLELTDACILLDKKLIY